MLQRKKVFQTIDQGIGVIENVVSVLALVIICVIAFVQVVFRYLISKSIPWGEEVIMILMVLMAMLGCARGIRTKAHTEITGVANALPKPLGIFLRIVTTLINLAFLAVMTYSAFILCSKSLKGGAKTPYLRIPNAVPYGILFLGGVFMVYEFIKVMRKRIVGKYVGTEESEGSEQQ